MKRVDVYEVSRRVQTTELDYVELHQMVGRRFGPASEWVDVPSEDDEPPKFVLHSSQVMQLRHPTRPDVYLAIGPELFELLAPAVDVGLHRLREEQLKASENLLAANRGLIDRMAIQGGILERAESNAQLQAEVAQHMSNRIGNFHQANVLTRIWRAIRRAI